MFLDKDLDVGKFEVFGTGSISGLVYRADMICEGGICRLDEKRGLWAFAEGNISFQDTGGRSNKNDFRHLESIPFKADERGRFHVDGVPVGLVSVNIPYHITADIIGSHTRTAKVVEGKTSEVRFFDTSPEWEVRCKVVVGDGSDAQFSTGTGIGTKRLVENVTTRSPMLNIGLKPLGAEPLSFCESDWEELGSEKRIVLSDVHPGKYRLVVSDWMGSRGFEGSLYEKEIEIKPGGSTFSIPLGAGCITGAVQWSGDYRYMIHVLAVGKKTHIILHARCDGQGNFCARYLPEDEYTLWAHDYDAGWCKLGQISVKNACADIGVHKLAAGGTITGKVPARWAADLAATIEATDQQGIAIENLNYNKSVQQDFAISGLWPGKWVVKLSKGDRVIAQKDVELKSTETVSCELFAP